MFDTPMLDAIAGRYNKGYDNWYGGLQPYGAVTWRLFDDGYNITLRFLDKDVVVGENTFGYEAAEALHKRLGELLAQRNKPNE